MDLPEVAIDLVYELLDSPGGIVCPRIGHEEIVGFLGHGSRAPSIVFITIPGRRYPRRPAPVRIPAVAGPRAHAESPRWCSRVVGPDLMSFQEAVELITSGESQ